jgi:hypothetical protein
VDIHTLREKVLAGQYQVSRHADIERTRESLAVGDLVTAILSGDIIAVDVDPERGIEYLVEGSTWTKERLRVKIGIDDAGEVIFITVYPRKRKRARGKSRRKGKR